MRRVTKSLRSNGCEACLARRRQSVAAVDEAVVPAGPKRSVCRRLRARAALRRCERRCHRSRSQTSRRSADASRRRPPRWRSCPRQIARWPLKVRLHSPRAQTLRRRDAAAARQSDRSPGYRSWIPRPQHRPPRASRQHVDPRAARRRRQRLGPRCAAPVAWLLRVPHRQRSQASSLSSRCPAHPCPRPCCSARELQVPVQTRGRQPRTTPAPIWMSCSVRFDLPKHAPEKVRAKDLLSRPNADYLLAAPSILRSAAIATGGGPDGRHRRWHRSPRSRAR